MAFFAARLRKMYLIAHKSTSDCWLRRGLVVTGCRQAAVSGSTRRPPRRRRPRITGSSTRCSRRPRPFPCAAGLHSIPATVVEIGVFGNVPDQSFSNGNVEVKRTEIRGDLVGLEAGTSTMTRRCSSACSRSSPRAELMAADQRGCSGSPWRRARPAARVDRRSHAAHRPRRVRRAGGSRLERPRCHPGRQGAARAGRRGEPAPTRNESRAADVLPPSSARVRALPDVSPGGRARVRAGLPAQRGIYVHPAVRSADRGPLGVCTRVSRHELDPARRSRRSP